MWIDSFRSVQGWHRKSYMYLKLSNEGHVLSPPAKTAKPFEAAEADKSAIVRRAQTSLEDPVHMIPNQISFLFIWMLHATVTPPDQDA